jgi:hypothetical protein
MVRMTGTFTNDLQLARSLPKIKANGAKLDGAPETYFMLFDQDEKGQMPDGWLCH